VLVFVGYCVFLSVCCSWCSFLMFVFCSRVASTLVKCCWLVFSSLLVWCMSLVFVLVVNVWIVWLLNIVLSSCCVIMVVFLVIFIFVFDSLRFWLNIMSMSSMFMLLMLNDSVRVVVWCLVFLLVISLSMYCC